jgi:alanine racemase
LGFGVWGLGFGVLIQWLVRRKNSVKVKSIFSHLAGSDDPKLDSVSIQQNELFKRMAASIMHVLDYKPWLHLLNSNGIIRFQSNVNFQYDMVRFGIGMYGVGVEDEHLGLEKVHTLKAKVLQIKAIKAGEYISYNQSGKMNHDGKIAILSIGYSDGIPRSLYKGDFHFFINGKLVPIIGLICMDFCMVDISEAGVVIEGMEIEIFGKNVDIHNLAKSCDTIPYEILTGISTRVKRVFIQD